MKYKEGDRVRIRSKEWYDSNKNKFGKVWTRSLTGDYMICFDHDFVKYCGKVAEIFSVERDNYALKGIPYAWADEMIEGLAEDETKPLTYEETVEIIEAMQGVGDSWECPQGYQFVDEKGNVINAQKIVLEKKKKEYPKSYKECCESLYINHNRNECYEASILGHKIEALSRLLICRDAYWKIAGEKMGLGKPWEPDWCDYTTKYCILYSPQYRGICKRQYDGIKHILAFPTEEMRDAFYEAFKELIEECKELL